MTQQPMPGQLELAPVIFPKPPSRDAESEGSSRSVHLMESLRRHRTLVIVIFLVCLAGSGFLLYRRRNPFYNAASLIRVSPAAPKALTEDKQQIGPYENLVEEQIRTVTRYDVLADALKKLPPAEWAFFGPDENRAVSVLQKMLTVSRQGLSYDVEISLDGPDPGQTTNLVNTITDTYIDRARHEEYFERDKRLAILRDEQTHLQTELAQKAQQQEQLLGKLGVGSVKSDESSPYNEAIAKLQSDLTEATEQLHAAQSNLTSLQAGGSNAPGMQAAARDAAATDPGLSALKTSLNSQRGVLVQQMAGLTPSNPVYQQDEEQLKSIESQLQKNTADLQVKSASHLTDKFKADIYQKQLIVVGLRRQLMEKTQLATGSAPRFQQAQQLSSDVEHLQTGIAQVSERMRELEVDSSAPGSIQLLTAARVPTGPNKNKTAILGILLLLMSVGASAGTAVAIDYFDPHLYGAEDVKQVMGFPPLGLLLDRDHFNAEVSQQYLLRLAAALHHAVRASGARTFLFTATDPGGGTTTMVDTVARQLRALNMRTLTIAATNVDGRITYVSTSPAGEGAARDTVREAARDAARDAGRSAGMYGAPGAPGAYGAYGAAEAGDKLERQAPGPQALSVHLGEPSASMFSGSFVAQILSEHQNDYDVVLIDGGPLLISADAEYLARIADGTVVVTQSGRTTRTQLKRSAALLEKLHVPGVAVVLNRIQPDRADAALRQDIQDFQQQMVKQRGTASKKSYLRRIPVQERAGTESTGADSTGGKSQEVKSQGAKSPENRNTTKNEPGGGEANYKAVSAS